MSSNVYSRHRGNSKARLRFTAMVNFNSELPQHIGDINILTVTSQWEEGMHARGRGKTEVRTCSAYEVESKLLSRGVCLCVWEEGREREREGERETALMIDARLPPLCSIEWLQQKAQNNIHDSLLCFFPPLFSCDSACRRTLRTLRCRGCAETELATETGSLASTS